MIIRPVELTLKPLGAISIDWRSLRPAGARPAEDCVFAVGQAGLWGRVTLDAELALRIVAATLGAPASRVVRRLGSLERGVLAAHLAQALHALGLPASVHLPPPSGEPDSGTLAFEITLSALGSLTTLRIDAPRPLLPPGLAAARSDQSGRLASIALVEIGRTEVPARDLAGARAGDVIVFGVAAPPRLRVGAFSALCVLREAEIELAGTLAIDVEGNVPPGASSETQILPASSVELTAEIGRLVLVGSELLDLSPGRQLPIPATAGVELRSRGRQWARGERTDVDGEMAIRIITVYR